MHKYEQQGKLEMLQFDGLGELPHARYQDFVYLVEDSSMCASVLTSLEEFPAGPSGLMRVSNFSTIERTELMAGRVNELTSGFYTLCYATRESGGDAAVDFSPLSTLLSLTTLVVHPKLAAPRQVFRGQELVIRWTAASGEVSKSTDWIGLFGYGECPQLDLSESPGIGQSSASDKHLLQNKCFKLSVPLVPGLNEGEVRFKTGTLSGLVEARFFAGNSLDGQGHVCRRLHGSDNGLSKYCALEAVADVGPIFVGGELADGAFDYIDERDKLPGVEMACNKGRCVTGEVADTIKRNH